MKKAKKLKYVFAKKMFAGGDPNDDTSGVTRNDPAVFTPTGNVVSDFNWAPDATAPGLNPGGTSPAGRGVNWGKITAGFNAVAPYASNIANAFRNPAMPRSPYQVNPVTLAPISLAESRNRIARQTRAADLGVDKTMPSQSAAAIHAANLARQLEGESQVSEQEAFLNSRNRAEAAGMNLNAEAINTAAANRYQDAIVERNIAMQREQAANLSNASDKYISEMNEQRKAALDTKKWQVLSQMWKDSGVADRMLKKMQDQGIDDPLGIQSQMGPTKAAGGYMIRRGKMSYPFGGDTGPGPGTPKASATLGPGGIQTTGMTTATGPYTSSTVGHNIAGNDDFYAVDRINSLLAGTSKGIPRGFGPEQDQLAMQAYLWKQGHQGLSPENAINQFYNRPVSGSDAIDAFRQRISKVGYGPLTRYYDTPNIGVRRALGGEITSPAEGAMYAGGGAIAHPVHDPGFEAWYRSNTREGRMGIPANKVKKDYYSQYLTGRQAESTQVDPMSVEGANPSDYNYSTVAGKYPFGGFTPASKPFSMRSGKPTGQSMISPWGSGRSGNLGAGIPFGKFNPKHLAAPRVYDMGGDVSKFTTEVPDLLFENGHYSSSGHYKMGGTFMDYPVRPKAIRAMDFAGIEHMGIGGYSDRLPRPYHNQGGQMGHIPTGAFEEDHLNKPRPEPGPDDVTIGMDILAHGGKIHIKKANRGKFTASAKRAGMGVQEYARHILANKGSHSATLVKRANFARNASKWKHAMGGEMVHVFS